MAYGKIVATILVVSGLVVLSGQPVPAETAATPAGKGPAEMRQRNAGGLNAEQRLMFMTRNLGLTEEQQAKIKPLLEAEQADAVKLRDDKSLSRDERRTRMLKLKQETAEKIKAVLTPEQQKKQIETVKKAAATREKVRSARQRTIPPAFNPDIRLKRLTEFLGLSTDQQAKVKPILDDEFQELKKLQGSGLNNEQRRAKLQELNKVTNGKVREVLNPEQQKKFDDTLKKAAERRPQKKQGDAPPAADKK